MPVGSSVAATSDAGVNAATLIGNVARAKDVAGTDARATERCSNRKSADVARCVTWLVYKAGDTVRCWHRGDRTFSPIRAEIVRVLRDCYDVRYHDGDIELSVCAAWVTEEGDPASNDSEPDPECTVCFERVADQDSDAQLVWCDGCETVVHSTCYPCGEIADEDPWYCNSCAANNDRARYSRSCVLCPYSFDPSRTVPGGESGPPPSRVRYSMVPIGASLDPSERWVHAACVYYVPEVGFSGEDDFRVIGLGNIPSERKRLVCRYCRYKGQRNAPIQCAHESCFCAFHPLCAKGRGAEHEWVESESGHWVAQIYCVEHTRERQRERWDASFRAADGGILPSCDEGSGQVAESRIGAARDTSQASAEQSMGKNDGGEALRSVVLDRGGSSAVGQRHVASVQGNPGTLHTALLTGGPRSAIRHPEPTSAAVRKRHARALHSSRPGMERQDAERGTRKHADEAVAPRRIPPPKRMRRDPLSSSAPRDALRNKTVAAMSPTGSAARSADSQATRAPAPSAAASAVSRLLTASKQRRTGVSVEPRVATSIGLLSVAEAAVEASTLRRRTAEHAMPPRDGPTCLRLAAGAKVLSSTANGGPTRYATGLDPADFAEGAPGRPAKATPIDATGMVERWRVLAMTEFLRRS